MSVLKKIFLFTILPFLALGQVISPTNPYTKSFVASTDPSTGFVRQSTQQKAPILSDIVHEFDSYWEGRDYTKKGSGYKPFKRWANHWEDYLQKDGTIAPPAVLWEAWERKQQSEAQQTAVGVPDASIINWSNLGPSVVTNSSLSISGQGRINTIIKDPNNPQTLYVGAPAGGIWKSTDDGANWTPLSDDLPQIGVSGIAIDPNDSNTIYIATGDDDAGDSYSVGVMKSTDGGQTWNTTGLSYLWTLYKTTNEIFIDPIDSSHIWVASSDGLQKSEDGGDTWVVKQAGNIVDFRLHPDYENNSIIYAVGYDNSGSSKFYRSNDKGESFAAVESIPNNSNRIVLETTPSAPDRVYVLSAYDNGDGTYEGRNSFQGLYASSDAGLSFSKTEESDDIFGSGQSWYDMALTVSDTDPNVVFVGVLNIWKSTNGGNDFTQLNSWYQRTSSFTHADIHFMRYFDGVFYAGTDGGIYRSADDGNNFEDLSNTLSIAQIYTVSTSRPDSSKLASGLQDCGGFAMSGSNWNSYHGGDGMGTAVDPFEENTYYGMTQYGGRLYRTTTGGDGGWSTNEYIAEGPEEGEWITPMEFAENGKLYAGYDQLYVLGFYKWEQLSDHYFGNNIRLLSIDPIHSNIIYVGTLFDVYKSTDGGLTFSRILTSADYLRDIEIHKTDNNRLWVLSSTSLYTSTDQGQSFTSESTGLESARAISHQQFSSNDSLYLGTVLGMYYTDNEVDGWHSISSGLPNVKVSDIEINPNDNMLTVSTYGRGIWQTPIPPVTRPSYDLDLIDLKQIVSDYRCQNDLNASIQVYNSGTSPINSFSYESLLNDISQGENTWTGTLAPGEVLDLQFDTQDTALIGSNTLSVDLSYSDQTFVANNSMNKVFEANIPPNYAGQKNTVFTFETNEDDWIIVGDAVWEKGIPDGADLNQVISGTTAYATNLTDNYPQNSSSSLVSPCFDLSNIESGFVQFYIGYELETGYDFVYFQYSVDSGLNWTTIETFNGFDATLKQKEYTLSQEMLTANTLFRFHLISDDIIHEEGAVIDDFIVEGTTLSFSNDFNQYVSVYPNPTKGVFTIDISNAFQIKDISIFSLESKRVYNSKSIISSTHTIDFTNQSGGLYFVELTTTNGYKIIRKLLVE